MPDSVKARQLLRLPGSGRPMATTRRLLASMTTCRLVEYRYFFLEDAMVRWRVGTRVPTTM
jgi:DNA-binding IclR family transcriptional regulator